MKAARVSERLLSCPDQPVEIESGNMINSFRMLYASRLCDTLSFRAVIGDAMKESVKERIITLLALSKEVPREHLCGCIKVLCEIGNVQTFCDGMMNDRFPGQRIEDLNETDLDFLFSFLLTLARKNLELEQERRNAESIELAFKVINGGRNNG